MRLVFETYGDFLTKTETVQRQNEKTKKTKKTCTSRLDQHSSRGKIYIILNQRDH